MTSVGRRRMKRRRRFVRNVKRTIFNILMMPARLPRITVQKVDQAMKTCEIAGTVFVTFLMVQLSNPSGIGKFGVTISAMVFIGLLIMIKLGDYQDQLEEFRYYG